MVEKNQNSDYLWEVEGGIWLERGMKEPLE